MYLEHMLFNYIFVCFYKYYPKLNEKKKIENFYYISKANIINSLAVMSPDK